MTAQAPIRPATPEFTLSRKDFAVIAAIAHREFGLHLPDSKLALVQSRLAKRLRALGLSDFAAYRALLEGRNGAEETVALLSALTTNVTRFFREIHHFDLLIDQILPDLIARARAGGRVRLWSAACSSGQEPYSIALCALKLDPQIRRTDFKILATDIDPAVVEKAGEASYRMEEVQGISPRYFRPTDLIQHGAGKDAGFTLSDDVRGLITLGVLNLMADPPFAGPFDVIFCRNVAIYFDRTTQLQVWHRLSGLLAPGGHLFIGHSERIAATDCPDLAPAGITVYRKTHGSVQKEGTSR